MQSLSACRHKTTQNVLPAKTTGKTALMKMDLEVSSENFPGGMLSNYAY